MSEKKRFGLRITCGLLAVIMPVIICIAAVFILPTQYSNTFFGELNEKHDRLSDIDSPKIVVLGGSSVAFGIDSAMMEQYTGYDTVNFGLYADLGTKIMLDLSRDDIREGDIVILAPELDRQTLSLYFNGPAALKATDDDKSMLLECDIRDYGSIWGGVWDYVVNKIKYMFDGAPDPTGVYNQKNFNEYGDISPELFPREDNIMAGGYDKNKTVTPNGSIFAPEFIEYVNDYIKEAEKKGATVYYTFCPVNRLSVDLSPARQALGEEATEDECLRYLSDRLLEFVQESINCPVLGDLYDHCFDYYYFYDTNFHLNDHGVPLHTARIIDDLTEAEQTADRTTAESDLTAQGGYMFSDKYLIYRTIDADTCRVYGVTKTAKQMDYIVIPGTAELSGRTLRVTEIDAEALKDTKVQTFVVTSDTNLTALPDHLFSPPDASGNRVQLQTLNSVFLYCPPTQVRLGQGLDVCKYSVPKEYQDAYSETEGYSELSQLSRAWINEEANIASRDQNFLNVTQTVRVTFSDEYFVYEKDTVNGKWNVVGLTDAGKVATALTIPKQITDGEGVSAEVQSISEYAFSEATELLSVIIPSDKTNPFTIGNYAFFGSSVINLYIFSDYSTFAVPSADIYTGASDSFRFRIYGSELLDGFQNGYGWQDIDSRVYSLNSVSEAEIMRYAESDTSRPDSPLKAGLICIFAVLVGVGVWQLVALYDDTKKAKKEKQSSPTGG